MTAKCANEAILRFLTLFLLLYGQITRLGVLMMNLPVISCNKLGHLHASILLTQGVVAILRL